MAHAEWSTDSDNGKNRVLFSSNARSGWNFVPIRPKPVKPQKAATSSANLGGKFSRPTKPPSHKKCDVPICKRVGCRLQTHKNYANVSSVSTYQLQGAATASPSRSSLPWANISGLPELPLGHEQPVIYRAMFHQFFVNDYDRIVLLLQPPPLSKEQRVRASQTKNDLLAQALHKPVFCLNYVATAYHNSVLAKRKPSHDSNIAILHGKVLQLLRKWLADFRHEDVDCLLLVVILTLVMLDVAAQNYRNLNVHRKGMEHLVNSIGGVHNLVQA